MQPDENTTAPSVSTSTADDEEKDFFYELLAEQRY